MPLSLLLVIAAAGAAVHDAVRDEEAQPQPASASSASSGGPERSRRHYWIVRSGHTLSEISSRTGVSVARLEALNPGEDLTTLQLGQRVKVR